MVTNEYKEKRKLRKKAQKLRKYVFDRDNGKCYLCGRDTVYLKLSVTTRRSPMNRATLDHKVPLSKGGTNDLENLANACYRCNILKDKTKQKPKPCKGCQLLVVSGNQRLCDKCRVLRDIEWLVSLGWDSWRNGAGFLVQHPETKILYSLYEAKKIVEMEKQDS